MCSTSLKTNISYIYIYSYVYINIYLYNEYIPIISTKISSSNLSPMSFLGGECPWKIPQKHRHEALAGAPGTAGTGAAKENLRTTAAHGLESMFPHWWKYNTQWFTRICICILYIHICIYIYMYIYICVYTCVCVYGICWFKYAFIHLLTYIYG